MELTSIALPVQCANEEIGLAAGNCSVLRGEE